MTTKIKIFIFCLLFTISFAAKAQVLNPKTDKGWLCSTIVYYGDTIPVVYITGVTVYGTPSTPDSPRGREWYRLVYNVKKVYPYAKIAGKKFNEYSSLLANVKDNSQRKALMKGAEAEIERKFGKELRDLTFTQGRILLKLIDRETNTTSYDILKEFRGTFRAFFYQTFARFFGYNLKSQYHAAQEDADIELIVLMIESGSI